MPGKAFALPSVPPLKQTADKANMSGVRLA